MQSEFLVDCNLPWPVLISLLEPKMMKQEQLRLMHEQNTMIEQITDNTQKIKQNKVLPYLVGNVVEILDMENEGDEEGAVKNEQNAKTGKCAVIKTSSRQVSTHAVLASSVVPHH